MRRVVLGGGPGVELKGVDLGAGVDDGLVLELRAAVDRYRVAFLRDQTLNYNGHVALAARFGELAPGHPIFAAPPCRPALRVFDSRDGVRANHWHTDLTYIARPPALSFLRAVVVPDVGGDTMWADAVLALRTLPGAVRAMAEQLRVVHSNDSDYTDETVTGCHDWYVAERFECENPAVAVHPETGEEVLLLGGFARRCQGLAPQMSRDVLRLLQDHLSRPEHCVRWRWRPGDLAIWDNLTTVHYAVFDYGGQQRRFERVTTTRGAIVGIDGRPSVVLRGPAEPQGPASPTTSDEDD